MSLILPEQLNELKPLPHWVIWVYNTQGIKPNEKPKKVPKNPRTGKNASPTNPNTWTDFDTATTADKRMGLSENRTGGIGFMFGLEPSGYAGVDVDDCIAQDGSLSDMAADIVRIMDSYTEISASGHGLHILFKLDKPLAEIGSRKKDDKIGLEIYDSRRYFATTGHVYGEPKPIAERTKELQQVYDKYMGKPETADSSKKTETPHTTTVENPVDTSKPAMTPQDTTHGNTEDLSDSELWDVMFASEHGQKIRKLYNGDYSDYKVTYRDGSVHDDNSGADLALCSILAWWTHGDSNRVDRMFRQTGLMRPKWDERHGAQTYGALTIGKAMNNRYEPEYGHVREYKPAVSTDIELSTDKLSTVGGGALSLSSDNQHTQDNNTAWTPPLTAFDYIDSGSFFSELQQFQKLPPVFSGLQNFDEAQGGFVPGLYVLGATPSLGKTTFMSQIADNIAEQGYSVLFFSLEQSRLEMTTKSLSRITAQIDSRTAISSINIRRGHFINDTQRRLVDRAIAKYQEFSRNISIIECGFDATVSNIAETVERFIDFTGLRPIVIVDYLQILQADKDNQGGRDAIECVIRALKRLQVDNSLVMFVISSFNRSNYSARVDYSSFKETGLIEYSCDVLLGMQPTIMVQDSLFVKEKADKAQRAVIEEATKKNPRKVMLTCLKNRYGKRGYSCGFIYDARFDLFVPDENFKENGHDARTVL